jgi:hypothetical protein
MELLLLYESFSCGSLYGTVSIFLYTTSNGRFVEEEEIAQSAG